MRIVLDTNVLVAGLLNPHGHPASVLNVILNGSVTLLVDERILFEYRDVLGRPKFDFDQQYIEALLDFFENGGEKITASPADVQLQDPDDVAFYEVATTGRADFLITGNLRHFPQEPFIVSPSAFVSSLQRRD